MNFETEGLYAIVDPRFVPEDRPIVDYVNLLLDGGCQLVQVRVKDDVKDPDVAAKRWRLVERVMELKAHYNFCCIVNDDLHCAAELGADGAHIGKDDGTIAQARAILGPDAIIGYSSHELKEAVAAAEAGASYVAFGAVFATGTKGPGHPVQGIARLQAVVDAVPAPVVAIGGICRENILQVWQTGVSAVAMITGLSKVPYPQAEAAWYTRVLEKKMTKKVA